MISGFGKFCVKEKNERKGRNPATGENMMLRPRKVVTFNCSGKLIMIQGDHRETVKAELKKRVFKVKLAGG